MKKTTLMVLATMMAPMLASAHQAGDFLFRAGTATVRPNAGSDNVLGLGSLDAKNNTQLGLTFGYMVTDNIGVELLAATPFRHKVTLGGTDLATVHQLPPTLMAQYYFGDKQDKLRPYRASALTTPLSSMRSSTTTAKRRVEQSRSERFLGCGGAGRPGLQPG